MINPKELKRRIDTASKHVDDFRSLLQVAYDYTIPERNMWRSKSKGREENTHIYDETAVKGLVVAANKMQGALMPPQQNWMEFGAGTDFDEDVAKEVADALTDATKVFFSYLHQSNFDTEINPCLQEVLISTGCIQIDEEPVASRVPFRFTHVSANEIKPEKPAKGIIENVHREMKVEARHIPVTWPKATIPQTLQEILDRDEYREVTITVSQIKDEKQGTYKLVVMWNENILFEEDRDYKFLICFRETVVPGEVFGRGPIIRNLPVIRRVNKVTEFMLQNAALQISGVYTGVGGDSFNPHTMRIAPGTVIPVDSNDNANPTLRALDRSGDLGLANMLTSDMQEIIKKALYIDPLGDITDPTKTATEVTIRRQEQLQNQGAAIGRLKTELLQEIVRSCTEILKSRGKLPKTMRVNGSEIKIVYQSPLAKAEKLDDFQNMQTFLATMQQVFASNPEAMAAVVKIEELPGGIAEMLGVDSNYIRSQAERTQVAEAVSNVQQQASAMG
jgi:hypothetical protein